MVTIIKVFVSHKIFSEKTILSAYTHTHTHRHLHTWVYWLYKIIRQVKQITHRDLRQRKTAVRRGKTWQLVYLQEALLSFYFLSVLTQYCHFSLNLKTMPKTWQLVYLQEALLSFYFLSVLTQYCHFSLNLKIMPKTRKCSLVFVSIHKYFLKDLHFNKRKQKVKKWKITSPQCR